MSDKAARELREEIIEASMKRTGKTREQVEAFLDILGSGFRRNGWAEGEPLSEPEIETKLSVFLGTTDGEHA